LLFSFDFSPSHVSVVSVLKRQKASRQGFQVNKLISEEKEEEKEEQEELEEQLRKKKKRN